MVIIKKIRELRVKRSLPAKEQKEFKNFVETYKNEIVQKWIDYFVYHKSIKCVKIEGKLK